MNSYSTVWNSRATGSRNATFWETLIEDKGLVVWNTEEATRVGSEASNHSTIDLTLSSPNVELNWSIGGEDSATGSDHVVIIWGMLGERHTSGEPSDITTGWDISGWKPVSKAGDVREAAEQKNAAARECYLRAVNRTAKLNDDGTTEQVEGAAAPLRESMSRTLDEFVKKKRWCSRLKRWWSSDLRQPRKELGSAGATDGQQASVAFGMHGGTGREPFGGPRENVGTGSCRRAREMMSGLQPGTHHPEPTRPDKHWWVRTAMWRKGVMTRSKYYLRLTSLEGL